MIRLCWISIHVLLFMFKKYCFIAAIHHYCVKHVLKINISSMPRWNFILAFIFNQTIDSQTSWNFRNIIFLNNFFSLFTYFSFFLSNNSKNRGFFKILLELGITCSSSTLFYKDRIVQIQLIYLDCSSFVTLMSIDVVYCWDFFMCELSTRLFIFLKNEHTTAQPKPKKPAFFLFCSVSIHVEKKHKEHV